MFAIDATSSPSFSGSGDPALRSIHGILAMAKEVEERLRVDLGGGETFQALMVHIAQGNARSGTSLRAAP